jgi:hypothetical protein
MIQYKGYWIFWTGGDGSFQLAELALSRDRL